MDRFLSTKFFIPQERHGLIHRQRLFKHLEEGLSRKLILLSAPAGFGKTSLLSAWIRQTSMKVVWISLDETDNDLARFLFYLLVALHQIETVGASEEPGSPIVVPLLPDKPTLTGLINQAATISNEFVIVLDDYHLITDSSIHEAIDFLLERLPPQMHVVIATRSDPALSLARLRARDQMVEIRAAELRFTQNETTNFLTNSMSLDIDPHQVNILTERTEGWITGLQLAALSLKQVESISDFISSFSGTHEYIAEYLTQEILAKLQEDRKQFLLLTAILERLAGPLCDAVTGLPNGQKTLEELHSINMFIVPLDNQKVWYRYHRLFADLLTKRLEQSEPDLVSTLHQRASLWFEQHGFQDEAINHALKSGDFNRAGALINIAAETTLAQSQLTTFSRWLKALPDEVVRNHSNLFIYQTLVLMISGSQVEDIEERLDVLEQLGEGLEAGKALLRAYLSAHRGQTSLAVKFALAAYEQLPDNDQYLRIFATWLYAFTLFYTDDREDAVNALNEVLHLSRKSGNVMIGVTTLSYLALLHSRQGQLEKAELIYQQALDLATDERGNYLPIAGEALIGLGTLKLETYQLEEAEQALLCGTELAFGYSEMAACEGYLRLAQLHQTRGNYNAANQSIEKAEQLAFNSEITEIDDLQVNLLRAKLAVGQGKIDEALLLTESWILDQRLFSANVDMPVTVEDHLRKYRIIILARMYIAKQEYSQALEFLDHGFYEVEILKRKDLILEIQILRAITNHLFGNSEDALKAIEYALDLGESTGFIRLFVDEGKILAELLYKAVTQGINPEFAGKLLALIPDEILAVSSEEKPENIIEPLTKRELDVLRLIAEGDTNREIAQSLTISLNTVKGHTHRIYSKLKVQTRTQAVIKAKFLNILQ